MRNLHPRQLPEFNKIIAISCELFLAMLKQPAIKFDPIWSIGNPIIIPQALAKKINPDYVNFIPFEYKWKYYIAEAYLNS